MEIIHSGGDEGDGLVSGKAGGVVRAERGSGRWRRRFGNVERGVLVLGLLEGVSLDSVAILDEEIDDGGGEAGFDDAGGGLEIGDDSGNSIGLSLLPWERHG